MSKRKTLAPDIKAIINNLTHRSYLCSVGKERLQWWKKNGLKFSSAKQAILTWDARQINAWMTDRGRHYQIPNWVRYSREHKPTVKVYFNNTKETREIRRLVKKLERLVRKQEKPDRTKAWYAWYAKKPDSFFGV